ncbi:MAG: BlaI/MecI/CopY family transcriptional regulator [Planctomycetota bacterium]|nr:BlaI/MecI/CopY family transcriptional regulator [Planctomycetota bacterium]
MTDPKALTSLQLAVLRVLWDAGEATVNTMVERLAGERDLAPTTVATLLTRLEKRGYVARRRDGRQYLYRSLVELEEARRTRVDELAADLFEGDVSHLVHHLLSRSELAAGDLERVKALINAAEAGPATAGSSGSETGEPGLAAQRRKPSGSRKTEGGSL